jgi:glycosyltransferase involved in cell wall biosynthesis
MIKVTALTSGRHAPASRFRVRQFIGPLAKRGIQVVEHSSLIDKYIAGHFPPLDFVTRFPGVLASRRSDITWLERELIPGRRTLECLAGRKRVLDVDDAIWLLGQSGFSERIAGECEGVIAGNQFIANHYRDYARCVWVIPTSIETEVWKPSNRRCGENFTVGWIGSSSNLNFISVAEEPLARFLAHHSDSELLIVCNRKPSFSRIPRDRWRFVRWSPATDVELVRQMDVGLMPLEDTEWARGKCAFKMISYMSVGIPVIVSPVGVNAEILRLGEVGFAATTSSDWFDALCTLYVERDLAAKMGRQGRRIVENHFSVAKNADLLARVFQEVAAL